jgi:hypothetical protein
MYSAHRLYLLLEKYCPEDTLERPKHVPLLHVDCWRLYAIVGFRRNKIILFHDVWVHVASTGRLICLQLSLTMLTFLEAFQTNELSCESKLLYTKSQVLTTLHNYSVFPFPAECLPPTLGEPFIEQLNLLLYPLPVQSRGVRLASCHSHFLSP